MIHEIQLLRDELLEKAKLKRIEASKLDLKGTHAARILITRATDYETIAGRLTAIIVLYG